MRLSQQFFENGAEAQKLVQAGGFSEVARGSQLIRLDTVATNPDECVDRILSYLESNALSETAERGSSNGRLPRL